MAKNTDPKCKKCRREGEKLFLKGDRCYTAKCSMVRRNYPPGLHGQSANKKLSDYSFHLREKQKARRIYGLLEKQFKNYFVKASKKKGVTGDILLQFLESRLDNVIYRLGMAKSRMQARQIVNHGHVLVNKKPINIPSYQVREGDMIEIKENSLKNKYFDEMLKSRNIDSVPSFLKTTAKSLKGEMVSLPNVDDIEHRINTQLIVEYYSK